MNSVEGDRHLPILQKSKERKEWVDALRAVAMLFVIYGHYVPGWSEYFVFTSPIKIPLFFAITGYVFKDRNGKIDVFVKNITIKIIFPWLCLTIFPITIYSILKGYNYFLRTVYSIIIGESFWYMPCCICAEIVFFFIKKYAKSEKIIIILCFLFSGLGYFLGKYNILNVFMINRALVAQIFILIGSEYKLIKEKLNHFLYPMLGAFLILGGISLLVYPSIGMDIHKNYYYNIPICLLMIVFGTIVMFILFEKIRRFPRCLVFIGQNTLVYYLLSDYVKKVVEKIFNILLHIRISNRLICFCELIVTCVVLAMISIIINTFFPWLVGKKRR